jgi:aldose 1-epimerase
MIDSNAAWGQTVDGGVFSLLRLQNDHLRVQLTNRGAALVSLETADRNGRFDNVVAGGTSPAGYATNPSYFGATIGRFANRIGQGRFWLNGREFVLPINNGKHHLHGGINGLTRRTWHAEPGDDSVTFRTASPDGEEGYPGNLDVAVTYRLERDLLVIEYRARTDAPTVINLTNHTYWNLAGSGSILNHQLQLHADSFLEIDADVLPTGTILNVAGTACDFRNSRPIGECLSGTSGGYDNCFVIRDWDATVRLAAVVREPQSGRVMEVYTTKPGVQLYTANHFDGSTASAGLQAHEAFCLECQHFPDSPNALEFPSTVLYPGIEYRQTTMHRFAVA